MLAVVILIVSACFLYCKKLIWSFVSSIIAMALTCVTGYNWKLMLISSGKNTTLLGFKHYPAALIILALLLLAALILLILSIFRIAMQNKTKGWAIYRTEQHMLFSVSSVGETFALFWFHKTCKSPAVQEKLTGEHKTTLRAKHNRLFEERLRCRRWRGVAELGDRWGWDAGRAE